MTVSGFAAKKLFLADTERGNSGPESSEETYNASPEIPTEIPAGAPTEVPAETPAESAPISNRNINPGTGR